MLVAFASFVLHGPAMARITPMHATSTAADHGHHHGGTHHHHVVADVDADHHGGGMDALDHHESNGLCCGTFCSAAITPLARDTIVSRTPTIAVLPSFEENGHGLVRESPRKPPRTPDIA